MAVSILILGLVHIIFGTEDPVFCTKNSNYSNKKQLLHSGLQSFAGKTYEKVKEGNDQKLVQSKTNSRLRTLNQKQQKLQINITKITYG